MISSPIPHKRLQELDELLSKLGVSCGRLSLLEEALTHSSYASENPGCIDNERLEFFGDSVLKFVVSEYLLERFPEYNEGDLTEIRSVIVSSKILAEVGESLNLGKYSRLGRRVCVKPSILAGVMEAIIGAIYLDSGLIPVQNLIIHFFGSRVTAVDRDAVKDNYKAQLQEHTQRLAQGVPAYTVESVDGPAHAPTFTVVVVIEDKSIASGSGHSKKEAEQEAAKAALLKLNVVTE